jgi:hypothetical protein
MTTDTLITAADDTKADQVATTAETPEVLQGNPAQTDPQANAEDKPAEAETPAQVEYEAFAIPDGVVADESVLGEFKAVAKELNLSQKDAQRLADLSANMALKQQQAARDQQTQWAESAKTDKEFGGDAFSGNLAVAKKALDTFASKELRGILDATGLGNHPEVIRTFVRIGKQISEDGSIVRGSKADSASDPAKRLFPNQA